MDEMSLLAINYTSGSTGRPKGVMYTHRGAYLQALAMAFHSRLGLDSSYLWTLPMFHCNGWCFTWAVTAAGAVHVCQRQIDPAAVWIAICSGHVTHLCAAPTVLTMIAEAAGFRPGNRSPGPCVYGRRTANARIARQAFRAESASDASVRIDGNLWSVGDQRLAAGVEAKTESEKARLNARQGVGNIVTGAFA